MNDLIANRSSVGFARRGVAALAIFAALATGIMSTACGGGGGSTDDGGSGGGSSGSASGTLYWIASGYTGAMLKLGAGTKQPTEVARLSINSESSLGYGGGMFTEVETTGILPYEVTVNLRDVAPNPYTLRSKLPTFTLNGFVNGPVQPSPDGRLFAIHTTEHSVSYVYVFDESLNIVIKLEGYESRSWLGNDRIVVVKGSNLYVASLTNSLVVTRIGPDGLGLPSEPIKQPSVSPDGTAVAYIQGSAVWRINIDGSGLTQVTKPYFGVAWPSWSPDGSRLVVSSDCTTFGGGNASGEEIIVVSATVTNQDLETIDFVTSDCGPVYWLPS